MPSTIGGACGNHRATIRPPDRRPRSDSAAGRRDARVSTTRRFFSRCEQVRFVLLSEIGSDASRPCTMTRLPHSPPPTDAEHGTPGVPHTEGTSAPHSQAARDLVHCIAVVGGHETGRRVEIGEAPVSIGRAAPCDLILQDPEVSRMHCRIHIAGNEAVIIDLGSTNGTFVDGRRVVGSAALSLHATFRIGNQLLRYEFRSRKEITALRDAASSRSWQPAAPASDSRFEETQRLRVAQPSTGNDEC
ncbi:MAG: FHA domain-containing protein [Burkholderiales bacterium]|nr:FHA domain-containing protein [Burkholderiales bacterium]